MKKINAFIFIFCYLLLTKAVFSETVEIDGKTFNCSSFSFRKYQCIDGKKSFIVAAGENDDYLAVVKDGAALKIRGVKKISGNKGALIYQSAEEVPDYEDSHYSRVAAAELIDSTFKNSSDPLAKEWMNEAKDLLGKGYDLKTNVTVRINGRGDDVYCNKGETRPFKASEIAMQKKYNVKFTCPIYYCSSKDHSEKILMTLPKALNGLTTPSIMIMKDGKAVRQNGNFKVFDGSALTLASFPAKKSKLTFDKDEEIDPKLTIPSKFDETAFTYLSELAKNNFQDEDGYVDMCSTDKNLAPLFAEQNKIALDMQNQLAEVELVEYLKIFNGRIFSFYVDKTKGQRLGCTYQNKIIDSSVVEHFDRLKQISSVKSGIKYLRPEEVQDLFKKAKGMKDIPYGYVQDGCFAKAHLLSRRFEDMGINVQKAWVKGKFPIPGSEDMFWDYHVAPTVEVKEKNGKIVNYVIDPTISSKAITLDEWVALVNKKKAGEYMKTSFPFATNAAAFNRTTVAISNTDIYGPFDMPEATEDYKMKFSAETLKKYSDLLASEGKK